MRSSAAAAIEVSRRASTTATAPATACADLTLADHPLAAGGGLGTRVALGLGGAHQRVGATGESASALLGGAQRQPGVHLRGAGGACRLTELVARGGVGLLLGRVLGRGEPLLEVGESGEVLVAGLLRPRDGGGEALGLALGRPGHRAELAELLRDGSQGRVGLVELGQGHVHPLLGLAALVCEPGDVEAESLAGVGGCGELLGGLVDRGLHLDQAGPARGAAGGEVGAEHVALTGDRGDVGQLAHEVASLAEPVDDGDLEQHPTQSRTQRLGAVDDVDGIADRGRQPGPGGVVEAAVVESAEQDPGATEVLALEVAQRADGGVDVLDRDGVGRGAEGGGDSALVARTHREQCRDRAEQA